MNTEYHVNYTSTWRKQHEASGLCTYCTKPARKGKKLCEDHVHKSVERARRHRIERYEDIGVRAKALHWAAKARAAKRGVVYSLDAQWFEDGIRRNSCALTGMPFVLSQDPRWKNHPHAPSVDRIQARGPYSPGNCRLVTLAVNSALNEWGEDVFKATAKAYLSRNN